MQTTLFYNFGPDVGASTKLRFGPVLTLVAHADTAAHDSNRYFEARMGLKFESTAGMGVILSPQYVIGRRWQSNSSVGGYAEPRVLGVLYGQF